MKNTKSLLLILLLTAQAFYSFAQTKTQIPSTNLFLSLPEGCALVESTPALDCGRYSISVIEINGVNFENEKKDFDNIEADYLEKGIVVASNTTGKLGKYDAMFLSLDSSPAMSQIILGDENFIAIFNVIAAEDFSEFNENEIIENLSSVEYRASKISPLEEHAKFKFDTVQSSIEFVDYNGILFVFEETTLDIGLIILQLPPMTGSLYGEEGIATQMMGKYTEDGMSFTILEDGQLATENFSGDFKLLKLTESGDIKLRALGLFTTSSDNGMLNFQFMMEEMPDNPKEVIINMLNQFSWK